MPTTSEIAKVYEKIIASLKTVSDVTKYIGSGASARVYGAHISTIADAVFPAISIHLADAGKETDGGYLMDMRLQIDLWFDGKGKNAKTWDDVMECYQAIINQLHRNGGWDNSIGIKIMEMTHIGTGPQMFERDTGLLHLPTIWRVRAKT